MKDKELELQVKEYCESFHSLNTVYEDYARMVGMTYTSLEILMMIRKIDKCTQKNICERTFLPKQTVNSIITNLYKQGLVEMKEMPEDRRVKRILLTDKGENHFAHVLDKIHDSEKKAMESLSKEQRKALIEITNLYVKNFKINMQDCR